MNANTQFNQELGQWLRGEAPTSAPAGFHAGVIDHARNLPQRGAWRARIRPFGRARGVTLLAAAALVVGSALVGSGVLRLPTVLLPEPTLSTGPFPSSRESPAASADPIRVAGPGGAWIQTGSMVANQNGASAVRLQDGRVLVFGGEASPTSAELYDPATGTWSATGAMPEIRYAEGALLGDGTVLAGDLVYHPATGTWSSTDHPMFSWSAWPNATVTALRDGRALVTRLGGAYLYDPATGSWAATGEMNVGREDATATLLSDGKVLVMGGYLYEMGPPTDAAEVYDPVTGSWTAIASMVAPVGGTATLLPDGRVLVTGSEPQVYDPATGSWSALPAGSGVAYAPATLLSDGTVLFTSGGCSAELYDSRTGQWTTASPVLLCGEKETLTTLLDGTVLKVNGIGSELYVPAGVRLPPLPAFPGATPQVFPSPTATPSPTPRTTPLPPAAGPVPPDARSWTVTVENRSSEPAALFVGNLDDDGIMSELVGTATPNVVPAGATVEVTFLFPAVEEGWIYIDPRPGEGGGLVSSDDIGIPGRAAADERVERALAARRESLASDQT